VNNEVVLFDPVPVEFPVATMRPREPRARLTAALSDLRHWIARRWQWLRPRTVPTLFAGFGLIWVCVLADYLAHAHHVSEAAPVHDDRLEIPNDPSPPTTYRLILR
jgi:hypothetical protein